MSVPSVQLPPAPPRRHFPLWFPAALALLLIALDQWLKAWAVAHLQVGQPPVPAVPGLVEWVLTYNTGAAWSMFSGGARILAVGRLLVGLGILFYLYLKPQARLLTVCLTLIAAGAVANAIDGVRVGQVTDMIHSPALSAVTRAINGSQFPIFNIADSCVVGGTLLLLLSSFWPERKPGEKLERRG